MPQDVPEVREIHMRLCRLQGKVMEQNIGYQHSADCFCGEGGFWPLESANDYRNEGLAVDFIEEVVEKALARDKQDSE